MIVIVCMSIFIVMAFKDGFMGLRFSSETYRWNSDMGIIHKGAEYTGHMLKNQTAKMEWCINNLKAQYDNTREKVPEELAILSRSIAAIKSYTDKARKYSGTICLAEEPCSLRTLLEDSFPSCPVQMDINISGDVYWVCDRMHMTEVFSNILSNAAEATQDSGVIEIHGGYDKNERFFLLSFTDHGVGMSKDDLGKMFTPYFTSKNTEKNFGLGLTYCKNVVERHGGRIHAESEMDKGTTVTIEFPRKKAAVSGGHEMEGQNG